MMKRILFTFMTILALYSLAIVGYRIYEPDLKKTQENTNYITYNSLREYTLSHGESTKHIYFFYSAADDNSNYVVNTVFPSINNMKKSNVTDVIEIVDITSLDTSYTTNRLKAEWGINSFPSLLLVSVSEGQISIDSTLCWDNDHPFTADDILSWLTINGITRA
mgnify:FL=1